MYITKDLYDALTKRKYGQAEQLVDKNVGLLETLRTISEWTGEVAEAQTDQLKRVALLIADSPVTITLNTLTKSIHYQFGLTKNIEKLQEKLDVLTLNVLGKDWKVTFSCDENVRPEMSEPKPAAKNSKRATSRGKNKRKRAKRTNRRSK